MKLIIMVSRGRRLIILQSLVQFNPWDRSHYSKRNGVAGKDTFLDNYHPNAPTKSGKLSGCGVNNVNYLRDTMRFPRPASMET